VVAPLFVLGRFRTFMGLDTPAREKLLDALMKTSAYAVRQLVMALKTMGALVYARDEGTRKRLMTPHELAPPVSGLISLRRKDTTHAA
jgi:hypothetical protein